MGLGTGAGVGLSSALGDGDGHRRLLRPAVREAERFLNPVPTAVGEWSTIFKVLPQYLNNKEERFQSSLWGRFGRMPECMRLRR